MRRWIYQIIEGHNRWRNLYDALMVPMVLASLIPLMLLDEQTWCNYIEAATACVFLLDYLLRWLVADLSLRRGAWSFAHYPFTPMAILDLLSIIPCFGFINSAFKVTRIARLLRILRVLRIVHHSKKFKAFKEVIVKEKQVLFAVLIIALLYIFVTALILFNVEPHINPITGEPTFTSFLDALYWATVTLTTVGYGDLCPVTDAGRIISMLSAFFGVAIIALPSGVITASYLEELHKFNNSEQ